MSSEVRATLLATVLLVAVGIFDYGTTPQVALGILYLVPVAFVSWKADRTTGLLMAAVATVMWFTLDMVNGVEYTSPWIPLWNAAARTTTFFAIVLLVSGICERQKQQMAANQRLQESMDEAERAAARVKELQSELQLICSWTNRIRSEGRWMRFEEFMQRNFQMNFTHGVSEEAVQRINAQLDEELRDSSEASAGAESEPAKSPT